MPAPHDDWDPRRADATDQLKLYDEMRGGCPVAHSQDVGWSVFRHADVVAVIEDPVTYSSGVSAAHPAVPSGFDPPRHTAYRRVVERYFEPADVAALEPRFRAVATQLVASLPREESFDIVDRFAMTYALAVQRAWLQWPQYAESALRSWVARSQRATRAARPEQLSAAAGDFDRTIRRVISDRRGDATQSDSDVTSRLLSERVNGVPLGDDEIVSILRNWTAGELGTMSAAIGILVGCLADNPELQQRLRRAPEDLPKAIDEILRMDAPLLTNRRVTTAEVELSGQRIPAGEPIIVFWASANRDEQVFGDPDAYRPNENAPHNLLYGRGIHVCPGEQLARLELRVALETLLAGSRSIVRAPGEPGERAAYPAGGWRMLPITLR